MDVREKDKLEKICRQMRHDCLTMGKAAGKKGFHYGATLSVIEIIAVLYMKVMNISKELLDKEDRDRFILSKGHAVPAVYAALKQLGILSEKDLTTFKSENTKLYAHPFRDPAVGIEFSSGSLGQGLSYAVGVALALKKKGNNTSKIYVVLGDGECNEGSVWEAAMMAAKHKLDNLTVVVDCNQLQYDGSTCDVMPMQDMEKRWSTFGWNAYVIDGHDIEQCYNSLSRISEKPKVVIANTIKGKGVSFMENVATWHFGTMTQQQELLAFEEVCQE